MRISCGWLDQYLYYRDSDEMSAEDLMVRLKGTDEPSVNMRASSAFHKFLEHTQAGAFDGMSQDGFRFDFAIDMDFPLSPIREMKMEHVIETHVGPVTLSGIVDALDGRIVHDYKLTARFDAERYADSYQWRAYLLMLDARMFVYDVFSARIGDDQSVVVHGYDRLPLCAYPGMDRDVARVAGELAEIIARYWPERAAA
jgi:hypothetical protein